MHAHAFSVSFPCVDLKNKGSPESSMNQIEANESARFYFCTRFCKRPDYIKLITHLNSNNYEKAITFSPLGRGRMSNVCSSIQCTAFAGDALSRYKD